MKVLVINSGSASVKFAVIDGGSVLLEGKGEPLAAASAKLGWRSEDQSGEKEIPGADHRRALDAILSLLDERNLRSKVEAVGHRVVHGGPDFAAPVRIDGAVIAAIESYVPLSPLHNPANLLGVRAMSDAFPELPQVAVFDTAFHRTMPPHAELYAVPEEWMTAHHVRRYGFQGINHQWVAGQACARLGLVGRHGILVAHLGNGCSVTAVRDGKSVETTMGFTPLEGLMMGTRSGDIDPAVVPWMAARLGISAEQVVGRLNHDSGLLGVSGRSNDVRQLDARDAKADLALRMFSYRASLAIAALRATLDRFDALVFTAGIGENAPRLRHDIVEPLGHLGLRLDPGRNERSEWRIDRGTPPAILVIPAGEEMAIAQATAALLMG